MPPTDFKSSIPLFELTKDTWGRVHMTLGDGTRFENVRPVRLFPFSDADGWISLRDGDGQEIVLIEQINDLPAAARALIAAELAEHEFVPVIQRIVRISGDIEPCEWEVLTDRGPTRFVINDEDDVRRIGGERVLVIDAFGIRYLIPDLLALDRTSRRVLEQYV